MPLALFHCLAPTIELIAHLQIFAGIYLIWLILYELSIKIIASISGFLDRHQQGTHRFHMGVALKTDQQDN